jgi:hypothetical protein
MQFYAGFVMKKLSAKAYGRLASPISLFVNFICGVILKGKVYKNNPRTADALKTEITNIVHSINGDELWRVFQNLMIRCKACIREHGD